VKGCAISAGRAALHPAQPDRGGLRL